MEQVIQTIEINGTTLTITTCEQNGGLGGEIEGSLAEGESLDLDEEKDFIYHEQCDALERFLLALACEGVRVDTPQFLSALDTTLSTIAQ